MIKKSPEEIAALKAKYAADNAEKEDKRAKKKEKFGDNNADRNMPVIEVGIPWTLYWHEGDQFYKKDVDPEKEPWKSSADSAEEAWRNEPVYGAMLDWSKKRTERCKVRIVRYHSENEEALRRLYGQDIVFIDRTGLTSRD